MSRGPGLLQRQILDGLARAGRWQYVVDLAAALWLGHCDEGPVPRSLKSALWRAARQLARRGLAWAIIGRCGLLTHPRPYGLRVQPRTPGSFYEGLVLHALGKLGGADVPYPQVWGSIRRRLNSDDDRHRTAFRRAILRLERAHKVSVFRREDRRGYEVLARVSLATLPAVEVQGKRCQLGNDYHQATLTGDNPDSGGPLSTVQHA